MRMIDTPTASPELGSLLDQAEAAIGHGDPRQALALLARLPRNGRGDEDALRADQLQVEAAWLVDELDREQLDADARVRRERRDHDRALERVERALERWPDDAWLRGSRAQCLLDLGRLDEAEADLVRGVEALPEAAGLRYALGIVRERQDRLDEADALFAAAARLDPEGFRAPCRIDAESFDRAVTEAIAELPPAIAATLEEVEVVVMDLPPDEALPYVGPEPLGHYALGVVHLFQRNVEKAASDRDEVVEQIRITLFHEVGHHLGLDEAGVERLGLA